MLFFAITMVVLALVCYTTAVWSYVISRHLHPWMVALFGTGFVFDVAGTAAMTSLRSGASMSTHGIIAWFAMALMLFLLFALSLAYYQRGRTEYRMRRFAVCAWALWTLSLFTAFV